LPTIKYNFISLDHLEELIKDAVCGAYWPWVLSIAFLTFVADVIGIVKHVGELTQVNSSKMNKQVGFLF
jgi:hypothetical protein